MKITHQKKSNHPKKKKKVSSSTATTIKPTTTPKTTTTKTTTTTTIKNQNQLAKNLTSNPALASSRFRIINETLYTSTGPEALELFRSNESDSQDFEIYHQGFQNQTQGWPQNPVRLIADELQRQYTQKHPPVLLLADLGCGQAVLARLLSSPSGPSPAFKVFSFDLVADPHGWVTVAECSTRVPLPGSSDGQVANAIMDVVVCCLSLMSTDWVGMILEARRILRPNGELRIAEVTSRFVDVDRFVKFITSLGFSNPTKDQSNTHFVLFKFTKSAAKPTGDGDPANAPSREALIKVGQELLKPCIYKRR